MCQQQPQQQKQRKQRRRQRRQQFFQKQIRAKSSCKRIAWQCKSLQLSLLLVLVIATTSTTTAIITKNIASEAKLPAPSPLALAAISKKRTLATTLNTTVTTKPTPPPPPLLSLHQDENLNVKSFKPDYNKSGGNECLEKGDAACTLKRPSLVGLSSLEKEVVDRLIKEWSPIVWLAPEEKFMPLGVEEFLNHVHSIDKDRTRIHGMPIGDQSERAYLVTNVEVDELLKNESSFIYGQNPNEKAVPIYAVVTLCSRTFIKSSTVLSSTRGPYIPLSLDMFEEKNRIERRSSRLYPTFKRVQRSFDEEKASALLDKQSIPLTLEREFILSEKDMILKDIASSTFSIAEENMAGIKVNEFIANLADNVRFSADSQNNIGNSDDDEISKDYMQKMTTYALRQDVPAFHVTYWMFYPYSQGKTMCTLSLGPLGHIPFPAVYGFCLGRRKDIGSHIGDWEHMSLYFNGAAEPEALYVSAHDAGAYYTFNRLTGSFEFKKQETRKGILQRPNFPKTVTTFNNHPVLFAAKGSHGLWTAPGKHRFVKVARLYDINGFGTLWSTWKAIQIAYENMKSYGRSFVPSWLGFKGKWGNPKSKCHPFRRIGLNFCELTDGPTGIPLKEPHFQCGAMYR